MHRTFLGSIMVFLLLFSGCASPSRYPAPLASIVGRNIRDLEEARTTGVSRTFEMPLDETFTKTLDILETEKLTVFMRSASKEYIVAMGFHRQIDTTRVGIFFDAIGEGSTKVTISSLSSTALPKAEKIIFEGLSL